MREKVQWNLIADVVKGEFLVAVESRSVIPSFEKFKEILSIQFILQPNSH